MKKFYKLGLLFENLMKMFAILGKFWRNSAENVEEIIRKFWWNFWKILTKFWESIDEILGEFWRNVGKTFSKCWQTFDEILKKFSRNIDWTLTKSWEKFYGISSKK